MSKIRKGATLLITTIVLSVVVITAGAFSGIYFRYAKMNQDYRSTDVEKVTLRSNIETAYERFLKNDTVDYLGEARPLRTYLLYGSDRPALLSVAIGDFIANFRVLSAPENYYKFELFVTSKVYKITSNIYGNEIEGFSLEYMNYIRME